MQSPALSQVYTPALVAAALLFVAYLRSLMKWRARSRGHLLPPGPTPLPLLGNVFDIPTYKPWVAYHDLYQKYGDIVHFRVFGQSMVILGNADIIDEYLDKRSSTTSGRQESTIMDMCGIYSSFAFMPYGPWWRRHRRAFWQHFHRDASTQHHSVQASVTHKFLELLLDDPKEFKEHIRYTFAASVLKIVYGIHAEDVNNKYLKLAEESMDPIANALVPGKFLVEHLPILKHVPSWFPGAGWKGLFIHWRDSRYRAKTLPLEYVKKGMNQQVIRDSMVGQLLADLDKSGHSSKDEEEEGEELVKNVGTVAFEAGSDTTFSTLQSAFLALSLNPDIVKKAQAELDAVVGPSRLPDFGDQESLVYVNAIVLEALRWRPVVPLSVPHMATVDDELRGYFIPEGTIIVPNTWACLHDPSVFSDPDVFLPERFIRDGKVDVSLRDPTEFAFGYGRRICPGRHFALAALFINLASVLHVFDITPAVDDNGTPIPIIPTMSDGFLSYPEDCRCTIKPRSAEAVNLIRSHASAARAEDHV